MPTSRTPFPKRLQTSRLCPPPPNVQSRKVSPRAISNPSIDSCKRTLTCVIDKLQETYLTELFSDHVCLFADLRLVINPFFLIPRFYSAVDSRKNDFLLEIREIA